MTPAGAGCRAGAGRALGWCRVLQERPAVPTATHPERRRGAGAPRTGPLGGPAGVGPPWDRADALTCKGASRRDTRRICSSGHRDAGDGADALGRGLLAAPVMAVALGAYAYRRVGGSEDRRM